MGMTMKKRLNEKVVCSDGFTMSVQADEFHYCEPRYTDAESYTQVEVGFPSIPEDLFMEYAEDPDNPTATVYAYVPSALVCAVIVKHGGVVSGELPKGIPSIPPELL